MFAAMRRQRIVAAAKSLKLFALVYADPTFALCGEMQPRAEPMLLHMD
jgi:hypothetical protein